MSIDIYSTETVPVPNGWTWLDRTTGRPWETVGDLLTYTGPFWVPPWEQLAAAFRPVFGPRGWNVHEAPPDTIAAPAVVIDAADDWQAPVGFRRPAWAFEVKLFTQRMKAPDSWDALGFGGVLLREAIRPTSWRWMMVEKPTVEEVGGVEFMMMLVGVAIMQEDPDVSI